MKSLLFFVLLIVSLPIFASDEMRLLVQITDGSVYAGHVPQGYRSVKLNSISRQGGVDLFLRTTTKEKVLAWREYVLTSGEYDHVSQNERRQIAANPLSELKVKSLLEIEEVYAIYKGNKLIGYFVKITDHVQAAIYQDGAWYDVFFDAQLNIVESFDRSA